MTKDQDCLETTISVPSISIDTALLVFLGIGFYAGVNARWGWRANDDFKGFVGAFTPVGEAPVDIFAPVAGDDESGFFHGPSREAMALLFDQQ